MVAATRALGRRPTPTDDWLVKGRSTLAPGRPPPYGLAMGTKPNGAEFEELTGDECRRLLATTEVGRLGVIRGGFPLVLPVNYALSGDRIVLRTDAGTKLSAARQNRVCFQADQIDVRRRAGWSVLVQGFAVEVGDDDPRLGPVSALPLEPWAPGERRRFLLITPISTTGRRIRRTLPEKPA